MRVFFALTLEESQKDALVRWQHVLASGFRSAKWTARDNFHLTMRYIGEVEEDRLVLLEEVLERTARRARHFPFSLDRADRFVKRKGSIWYAGMDEVPPALQTLRDALEDELARAGFDRDPVDFTPHVTLFRGVRESRSEEEIRDQADTGTVRVRAQALTLMESRSRAEGVVYSPLTSREMAEGVGHGNTDCTGRYGK